MKKNLKPICLGFAAVLMSASLLHAEEEQNMAIGGGFTVAADSLKKVTHNTLGLNVNISTQMPIASSNVLFRPGLGLSLFSGKFGQNNDIDNGVVVESKTQLVNLQATFDIMVPAVLVDNLTLVTGLSVNQWRYSGQTKGGNPHPFGLDGSYAPDDVKLGFRVGMDYRISKQWSSEVLFQMVEFGSRDKSNDIHYHNFNPTWLQFGVKYHF